MEVAVGASGESHVLAFGGAERLVDLARAAEWIRSHLPLLRALEGGSGIREDLAAVKHLFTERPRDTKGLVESRVRLHALARADSGRWVHIEIN
ncbi:MAG: hypothetical protein JNM07_08800 [Phycisphaerae bacterium]|nr:hypothetical protein [Phycisphaerae bacterium]